MTQVPCHVWQARRESNPQPAVLETAALPIELLAYTLLALSPITANVSPAAVADSKQSFFVTQSP